MEVKFTDEQQKVIDERGRNILVSAAAGSGKTAVLVERVITRLTADKPALNVDELLVVTFTDAAAAEMKVRIREAIEKALEEQPDNKHLQEQAAMIHRAQISTIHTFCTSVINEHFHVLNLDPSVRVGEKGEIELIKRDALEQVIEKAYETAEPDFLNLVECYMEKFKSDKLEELILKVHKDARSNPIPGKWLDRCVEESAVETVDDLDKKAFVREILNEIKKGIFSWKKELERAESICCAEDGPKFQLKTIQSDMQQVKEILQTDSFEKMQKYIVNFEFETLGTPRRNDVYDAEKRAQVKTIRDDFKKYIGQLKKDYFAEELAEIIESMRLVHRQTVALVELVKQYDQCFAEEKKKKNVIDFNDMEHFALQILTKEENGALVPSDIAKGYQAKFAEIMIDEYQDINVLQDTIMESVSGIREGKNNLFMVGDVKQSIYRFRLSCPELFMHKYHKYADGDTENCRIDLHKNFRSRKEVLNSTNFVFEQIMTKEFGGITYDESVALHEGKEYEEIGNNKTEIILLDFKDENTRSRREIEAKVLADKIYELVGSYEVYDKKTDSYRKARLGDIAILHRGLGNEMDFYLKVWQEAKLPVNVQEKDGYFDVYEIQTVLNYLRILDNPLQDIPYTAVLTSLFGGFTTEELAIIRNHRKKGSMHECVREYIASGEDCKLQEKLVAFHEMFERFREMVSKTPIHTLLWRLLDESGFLDCMAVFPNGEQRVANLEMLIAKASSFERSSYKGLFNFVRYIEQLKNYNTENAPASLVDEQMDAVTLMTVHKSKGLEFPIVFLIQCGKSYKRQMWKNDIHIHSGVGIGLNAIDPKERTKSVPLIRKAVEMKIETETAEEEARLLYVAMTRAREKLFLLGESKAMKSKMKTVEKLRDYEEIVLPYHVISGSNCYLDWLLLALYRNQCMKDIVEESKGAPARITSIYTADVPIEVRRITMEDLMEEEIKEEIEAKLTREILRQWDAEEVHDAEMKGMLEEQLSYRYPHAQAQRIKQKVSVSELKKQAFSEEEGEEAYPEEEVVPLLPKFLKEEEPLAGASRGTAYHKVMEVLDFTKEYDEESLKQELADLHSKGLLSEPMVACIRVKDILRFMQSDIGKRMHKASKEEKLHAEQPFVLGVDAKIVYPESDSEEMILIQGIIDAYFEEETELIVVDYKTDRVSKASELVDRYHSQLEYYAEALERLTGKKVKEKIIYSFTLQREILL